MAARIDLTFDCAHPTTLAEFWKLALGYEDEPPHAQFTSRLEWGRHFDPDDDDPENGAWLHGPAGVGPRLSLLPVPEAKVAKNRLHIDIRVSGTGTAAENWDRITATVERLVAAGGTTVQVFPGHHVFMADPERNEFCVA
jgi:hypothetical protein